MLVILWQTLWIKAKGYMKHPSFSRFSGPHLTLPVPQSSKCGWLILHHHASPKPFFHLWKSCWILVPKGTWTKLRQRVNKAIIGLINSRFVRDKITTDCFPQDMEHKSENFKWAWTLRQLCTITINSKACLCPQAEDVRQWVGLQQNMWLMGWFRLRNRQSTCQSDQSIPNKSPLFLHSSVGVYR